MNKPNDGGTAFPAADTDVTTSGMSLRAWLAATIQLREDDYWRDDLAANFLHGVQPPDVNHAPLARARWIAEYEAAIRVIKADALIAELEKEKP